MTCRTSLGRVPGNSSGRTPPSSPSAPQPPRTAKPATPATTSRNPAALMGPGGSSGSGVFKVSSLMGGLPGRCRRSGLPFAEVFGTHGWRQGLEGLEVWRMRVVAVHAEEILLLAVPLAGALAVDPHLPVPVTCLRGIGRKAGTECEKSSRSPLVASGALRGRCLGPGASRRRRRRIGSGRPRSLRLPPPQPAPPDPAEPFRPRPASN